MKILKEITVWPDNTPNHTYAINDAGKMVAYRKTGTKQWFIPVAPRMFDRRYRKFVTLEKNVDQTYFC